MAEVSLHHVHLVTDDVDGFCNFYTRNFGAEVVFDAPIDGDRNVFLKIGSGRIHLFETRTTPGDGRNAFHHLGMMAENLSAVVERLKANGVPVSPVTRVAGGGFAMVTGPQGMQIELFEASTPEARRFFVGPQD
jgi:catechol 2,3-dioxygenase-like lactoylglutathione lyase family enzyme